jgi:hypothetical protein
VRYNKKYVDHNYARAIDHHQANQPTSPHQVATQSVPKRAERTSEKIYDFRKWSPMHDFLVDWKSIASLIAKVHGALRRRLL